MFSFKGAGEIALALLVINCRHRRRVALILMLYEMINISRNKEATPENLERRNNSTEY